MTVDTTKLNILVPAYSNDRVVLADTVSYSIPAHAAGGNISFTYNKPSSIPTLPVGIFTYDGGATYSDVFASSIPPSGAGPSLAPLSNYIVEADSGDSDVTFFIRYLTATGATDTLTISFALLAFTSDLFPGTLASGAPMGGSSVAYVGSGAYRKIALQNDNTSRNSAPATTAHSIGTIPTVLSWGRINTTGRYRAVGTWNDPSASLGNGTSVYADATNIYVGLDNLTSRVITRVYWDNWDN